MSFLLDDVRDYLVAYLGSAWPVYVGYLPDAEARCIALMDTGGYPETEINRETENPTFQTRVRGGRFEYPVVRQKWQDVFDVLQDAQQVPGSPVLLPGVVFIQAMATGPLQFHDALYLNMTCNWRVKRLR